MAIPSIVIIPSGYNANKIYSKLPTNGSGDLDFARTTTATRVNQNGLIEEVAIGVPRLDYTDGGCPSLLLEPASANLITYSEDFSRAYYTIQGASVSSSTTTDPTGNQNSFKLIPDNVEGGNKSIGKNFASLTNLHTFSCFGKKAEYNYLMLRTRNGPTNSVVFNLDNGTFNVNAASAAFVSAKIEDYGNDWFRCSVTLDPSQMNNVGQLFFSLSVRDSGENLSVGVIGDGVSGAYIFGAQVEQQSYATSYIPTAGSQITRLAETANNAGNASTFNDLEGVLMAEISALDDDSTNKMITISNGSGSTRILIRYVGTSLLAQLRISGANQYEFIYNPTDIKDNFKIALKYKANDFSFFVNGFELDSSNSGSTFSDGTLTELAFDDGSGSSPFYGKTKQLQYYKTALTDSELETLTSYTSFNAMALAQNYTI